MIVAAAIFILGFCLGIASTFLWAMLAMAGRTDQRVEDMKQAIHDKENL